jgi:hypothetical protein
MVVGYPSLFLRTHAKIPSKASDGSSARWSPSYRVVVIFEAETKQYSMEKRPSFTTRYSR